MNESFQLSYIMSNVDEEILSNFSLNFGLCVCAWILSGMMEEDKAINVELHCYVNNFEVSEPCRQVESEATTVD